MTERFVVSFSGNVPGFLVANDDRTEVSAHAPAGSPISLTITSVTGRPAAVAIGDVLAGSALPSEVLLDVGNGPVPHVPFDVGALATPMSLVPGASLVVQHVKRRSIVGTLRYYERFIDGDLAEREWGVAHEFDVYVENTFDQMVRTHESGAVLDGFGGARVRSRNQSALVVLAGIYSSVELLGHLGTHLRENIAAARLVRHLTSDALARLQELTR